MSAIGRFRSFDPGLFDHLQAPSHHDARRSRNGRCTREIGAGIAANPHYPYPSGRCPFASSRSASLAIGGPQNVACGAVRSYPAMVWSAPFRGPAAPGKPFIISSRVRRSGRRPSDGLHFLSLSGPPQLVGIAAFRDRGIGRFPRRSAPLSSGWSCNHPSFPGGSASLPSDDLKLSRSACNAKKN